MYQQLKVLHWHSMAKPQKVLSGHHEEGSQLSSPSPLLDHIQGHNIAPINRGNPGKRGFLSKCCRNAPDIDKNH